MEGHKVVEVGRDVGWGQRFGEGQREWIFWNGL